MRARGFAVNRHALNTLRILWMKLEREEVPEHGPLVEREFLIPNMVCEGCATKIRTALQVMPGVREVKAKVSKKRIQATYEPNQILAERLKDTIGKAGFTALEA